MKLYVRQFGDASAPVVVILHGLAGSSIDWISIAEALAADYCVYTPDLRNHGKSPHSENMNYDCLTHDLLEWAEDAGVTRFHLIGHSIGDKNAMHFACKQPKYLKSLMIVDVAPKPYDPNRTAEFDAMAALEVQGVKDPDEADRLLKEDIPNKGMREYLLDSLACDESGDCHWVMNLPLLANRLRELRLNPLEADDCFTGPTLFIRGGKSAYTEDADIPTIKQHFPNALIELSQNSNHFPYRVVPETFLASVKAFIEENEP